VATGPRHERQLTDDIQNDLFLRCILHVVRVGIKHGDVLSRECAICRWVSPRRMVPVHVVGARGTGWAVLSYFGEMGNGCSLELG
jgi:hypothetical protein